ncbi:MAG: c-type cytochrome biogenesis protein CcmI [Agitococcus sp.]
MINSFSILFLVCAVSLLLVVAFVFVWSLIRAERQQNSSLLTLNIGVFKERLQELEQDYAQGKIDQETFDALKVELERQLLSLSEDEQVALSQKLSKRSACALFVLVIVCALLSYRVLAYQPKIWHWWQVKTQTTPLIEDLFANKQVDSERLASQNLADFARVLQKKLQDEPKNVDGWYMLAMAYLQGELPDLALVALEKANRLEPTRDDIALSYAQTLVFTEQGRLSPKSRELLMQVLNKHPDHEGALLLMGMGAFRSGDYAGALVFLPRLKQVHLARTGDNQGQAIEEIDKAIAIAQQGGEPQATTHANTGIKVTVKLAKELQTKLQGGEVLFVFAKALNGPPMPLAVVRQNVDRFPIEVLLNDSQSMTPELKLSKFESVIVSARISKTGTPQGESGDLEAVAVPVTQQGKLQQVDLLINQVKP